MLVMKLEFNCRHSACNQIKCKKKNTDKMAAKMALYYKNYKKIIFFFQLYLKKRVQIEREIALWKDKLPKYEQVWRNLLDVL